MLKLNNKKRKLKVRTQIKIFYYKNKNFQKIVKLNNNKRKLKERENKIINYLLSINLLSNNRNLQIKIQIKINK